MRPRRAREKRPRKRRGITAKETTTARSSRATNRKLSPQFKGRVRCIARSLTNEHPVRTPAVPQSVPPRALASTLVNGRGYIRLEIKSAIVSPLNELSHAYAYTRSSARACVRVLARFVRSRLHARTSLASAHKRVRVHGTFRGRVRSCTLRAFTGTKI